MGAEPAGGEVGQLVALVRAVQRAHAGDTAHVVVLGFSAGGYMALNLACAAPDLVIAVGVAAGGPYRCAEIAGGAARCMRGERRQAHRAGIALARRG